MKFHKRSSIVAAAEAGLMNAVVGIADEFELTPAELGLVVNRVLARVAGRFFWHEVQVERMEEKADDQG